MPRGAFITPDGLIAVVQSMPGNIVLLTSEGDAAGNQMKNTVTKSETDRTVLNIFPRENGGVWVLTSRGAYDMEDGELCTLDEFDSEGRFMRQLRLMGDGDLDTDAIVIKGDRVSVLTDRASARVAMMGSESDTSDDAEPMSVICYDLPSTERAAR